MLCLFTVFADECGEYDPQVYICCNAVLNLKPETASCCDTKAFNRETHMCCNSVINPRPSGTPACCQSMAHDSELYVCCFGTSNPRPSDNVQCCGPLAIDVYTQVCCEGVPNDRYPNTKCCATVSYDADYYKCCSGSNAIVPINDVCPPYNILEKFVKKAPKVKAPKAKGASEIVAVKLWLYFK